jgi:hypothetical protein
MHWLTKPMLHSQASRDRIKFVRSSQNNLKNGVRLAAGTVCINGKVFGSGGTAGNGVPVNRRIFHSLILSRTTHRSEPSYVGNRNGDFAISANALDALVPGLGQRLARPGIFGLAGVFTNPQFQVVIRALNQKKASIFLRRSQQRAARDHRSGKRIPLPKNIHSAASAIHWNHDNDWFTVVPVVDAPGLGDAQYRRHFRNEPVVGGCDNNRLERFPKLWSSRIH